MEHCGKSGPIGVQPGENILGIVYIRDTGAELGDMHLINQWNNRIYKALTCGCKGPRERGFSHPNLKEVFLSFASGPPG